MEKDDDGMPFWLEQETFLTSFYSMLAMPDLLQLAKHLRRHPGHGSALQGGRAVGVDELAG